MCGIFGYVGSDEASKPIFDGLLALEYRGYDSWGAATLDENGFHKFKKVGAISDSSLDDFDLLKGGIGFGHSRWATHGKVTEVNTHPHFNYGEDIMVVHNGIIDNYAELRSSLKKDGYKFISETDTEVIAHLVDKMKKSYSSIEAIKKADEMMEGRYAFLVMFKDEDKIYAIRQGAPLILGIADNATYIASDIPAFLKHTNVVKYLDDNELAIISRESEQFYDLDTLRELSKREITVDLDPEDTDLGEHDHYMIKEIMDQKDTLRRTINQDDDMIVELAEKIKNASETYFVGCGTAGKVGFAGTYIFSEIAQKRVNFEFASQFKHCRHYLDENSLVIAISQSGETADTIEALEIAKERGAKTAAILNVKESTIDRMVDYGLQIKVGTEKAVASTKATTSQLALVLLLAFAVDGRLDDGKRLLVDLCGEINDMLNPRYEGYVYELATKIHDNESMYIIGKGINYPIALEAAIKLQEVSYIHAEGFAAGELKHGPLALISENVPVLVLAPMDENFLDVISNATEVKSRGGYVVGLSPENNDVFDYWIKVPHLDDEALTSPIMNLIPIQILSYHLALLKGNNPDKPRNLAKSVTVK